jgi:hypothetical protein
MTVSLAKVDAESGRRSPCSACDDFFVGYPIPDEYARVGDRNSLPPSMRAASNPNYHVLKAVLANGKDLYYEQVNKELTRRREDGESLFPKSIVGYFDFL